MRVRDVMSRRVVTIDESDSCQEAVARCIGSACDIPESAQTRSGSGSR